MFGKKFFSLVPAVTLENPKGDYRSARWSGQYKVSARAIYRPDGGYIPFVAVTGCTHDQTGVHVSGCCAGSVPVERIVFLTAEQRIPLIFDTKKQVDKILKLVEESGSISG